MEFGDVDYYRLTLSSRSSVSFVLSGLTADANMELRDANDQVVSVVSTPQTSSNGGTLPDTLVTTLDPGTYFVRITPGAPLDPANPTTSTPATDYTLAYSADDGTRSDILWRDYGTGRNVVWTIDSVVATGGTDLAPLGTGLGWEIQAVGDFNSDSKSDIFWRNTITGENAVWLFDGSTFLGSPSITPQTDLSWSVDGAGDFNGDGQTDLLWRNTVSGQGIIWFMNGLNRSGDLEVSPSLRDLSWQIQGVGDFNQDGVDDIVWRNVISGANVVWLKSGDSFQALTLPTVDELNFSIQGTGDFNSDGNTDLLWRNPQTGRNVIWLMNGTQLAQVTDILPLQNLNGSIWQAYAPYNRLVPLTLPDISGSSAQRPLGLGVLNGSGVYREAVGGSDVADFYQFSISSPTRFELNLSGLTADLDVVITGSTGGFSRTGNQPGTANETISETLQPGIYTIQVSPKNPADASPYTLSLNANSVPVLVSNSPLTVGEGVTQTISSTLLAVSDANNAPVQITYSVASAPSGSPGNQLLLGSNVISLGNTFTQADINAGRLSYRHDGSETLTDNFVFTVSDGVAGTFGGNIPATTFSVRVVPTNDEPVLVTTNPGLTLSEGAAASITSTNLLVTDIDQTPAQIIYTVGAAPANGTLLFNGAPISIGSTFSQADLAAAVPRLTYSHNGSETTSDNFVFSVADGAGGTISISARTFSFSVLPTNDLPVLVSNTGVTVSEGASQQLTTAVLNTTDAELTTPAALRDRLTYTLASQPGRGTIFVNNAQANTFTQADIDNGRVFYKHNGTDTNSDSFTFTVSDDAGGTTAAATFNITVTTVNAVPVLTTNLGLTATEGAAVALSNAVLQVTDPDSNPALILYTLASAPVNGNLRLQGAALTVGQTFRQADIDSNSLLTYQHSGTETTVDSFSFNVSDGTSGLGGSGSPIQTFNIRVTPVNDAPALVSSVGVSVQEGAAAAINSTALLATDVDSATAQITYTVTGSGPSNGTLFLAGRSNITQFTQADLNSGNLRYQHNGSETNIDTFAFELTDGSATAPGGTVTLLITPTDDAPRVAVNTGLSVDEAASSQVIGSTALLVTDSDGPTTPSYSVIAAPTNGQLFLDGVAITAGQTFTQLDIDSQRLAYTHNGSETLRDSFTFRAGDGSNAATAVNTFSITVNPINDAPILTVPTTAQTVREDEQFSFTGANRISVSDADAGTGNIEVTLTVTNGTLSFASATGVTGNNTNSVTISGTQAAVNTTLGGLRYRGLPNYNGTDRVTVSVSDGGNTGGGGTLTDTETIELTVTAVNDPVSLTVPTGVQTIAEDTALTLTGITLTDADAGTDPYRVSVISTNGSLSLGSATGLEFLEGTTEGGVSVIFSGVLNDVQTALAGLVYQGRQDYFGSDSLTIRVEDLGEGGTNTVTRSIPISVTAVNDAPTFVPGANIEVNEDTPGNQVVTGWATGISRGPANESGQALTFTTTVDTPSLFTATGRPRIDSNGNLTYALAANANGQAIVTVNLTDNGGTANGGINAAAPATFTITALPVNDAPRFTGGGNVTVTEAATDQLRTITGWARSITAGAADETSQTLTFQVLDNTNPALFTDDPVIDPTTGNLTFTPTATRNGVAVLTVQLSDDGGTERGGVDVSTIQTLTINVTAVNDAPVLTVPTGPLAVEEDNVLPVTGVSVTDVDAFTNPIVVSLSTTSGTLNLSAPSGVTVTRNGNNLSLNGAQDAINAALAGLTYTPGANFSGTDTLTIVANDQGRTGGTARTDTETIAITVAGVNDAPTLSIPTATRTVAEEGRLAIAGIRVSDPDAGTSPVQVTFTAANGGTLSFGSAVAGLTGNGTSTLTYTGAIAALNTALGNFAYVGARDYSGGDTVTITVNDQGNTGSGGALSAAQSFSVNVTPVNDPPTLTIPSAALTVAEDEDLSFALTSPITVSDPDAGANPLRLTLTSTNGLLTMDTAGLTVVSGSANGTTPTVTVTGTSEALNAALAGLVYRPRANFSGSDTLRVTISDQGFTGSGAAGSVTQTLSISVTAVNDAPVLVSNQTVTLGEGASRQITSALLRTTDPDNTFAQLSYTVATSPINGTLLVNNVAATTFTQADIESNRLSYRHNGGETTSDSFVFNVTDGGNAITAQTFNIVVNPINDPPRLVANAALSVSEGTAATIGNTLLNVTDNDTPAEQRRYTLTSAPNNGSLRLGGGDLAQGQSFSQADIDSGNLSYRHNGTETVNDSFTFSVGDGAVNLGGQVFNITVAPTNDAPTLITSGPAIVSEDASVTIRRDVLFTSDSDTVASGIIYRVVSAPLFGSIFLNGNALNANSTFTQQDVDGGLVSYRHNGTESLTNEDFFGFSVTDGGTPARQGVFRLAVTPVNDAPVLATNGGLSIVQGTARLVTLGSSQLLASDADNTAAQLTYRIVSPPSGGTVTVGGTAAQTFTQEDINQGRVAYSYAGTAASDSFQFSLSDNISGGGSTIQETFEISFTAPAP